jgi:phosphate transport system substrate-binding protein
VNRVEEIKVKSGLWWRRLVLIIAIVMAGSLVLGACGDDDDDDNAEATSGTGQATATSGSAATATSGSSPATPTSSSDAATPMTGGGATSPTTGGGGVGATVDVDPDLSGEINIDGSSTVFPITQGVAEEFNGLASDVEITVGLSGTGGGFEKFCAGETDISNASRPIEEDEIAACEAAGVEYTELTVAIDGLTVVVNPENDWVDCITVEQLNMIWMPESTVTNWSDVDPSWPDEEIALYGPGTDSGTFDYFTDVVNGEEGASRSDYTASEDDNVLVQGVAGDEYGLGYFGYAYYIENQDTLKALEIDGGAGCVAPTPETVADGSYAPLSRPLFIYVSSEAMGRDEVAQFVQFYLSDAGVAVVPEVGYVPLDEAALAEQRATLAELMP